jgi:integrase
MRPLRRGLASPNRQWGLDDYVRTCAFVSATPTGAGGGLLAYGITVERNVVGHLDRDDRPAPAGWPSCAIWRRRARAAARRDRRHVPTAAATCAYTGLWLSEALGLRSRDLDLKVGTLAVTAQLGQDGERVPFKTPRPPQSYPCCRRSPTSSARAASRDTAGLNGTAGFFLLRIDDHKERDQPSGGTFLGLNNADLYRLRLSRVRARR